MTTFSATDAAFEGFRITREKPRVLLIWAGVHLVVSFLMPILMMRVGGAEKLRALEAAANDPNADPSAALQNLLALAPFYQVMIPLGLGVLVMVAAAVYRVILRPQDKGLAYLRLGPDELRLAALTLAYVVIAMVLVGVVVFAAGFTSAIAFAALGTFGGFVGAAVGLFAVGLLIYVAVRLSLAPVITFAEHRLAIFDSWRLTKGHFWGLLGTYALSVASAAVVLFLALLVFTLVAVIISGGDISAAGRLFTPDMSSVGAYFTPSMIAYTFFDALMKAIYYTVWIAPPAVIYRILSQPQNY